MDNNPYRAPIESETLAKTPGSRAGGLEMWFVGIVGAVVVTVVSFLCVMVLPAVVFPVIYESIPGSVAMYLVGAPLSIGAGFHSFRGTLRHYRK